ncbi:unnamed protein product [Amoebophrya sp. A120]|nr:unnamed protein product [Amoebophrya sp. A120]|eukprot:GSA120T00023941001.1
MMEDRVARKMVRGTKMQVFNGLGTPVASSADGETHLPGFGTEVAASTMEKASLHSTESKKNLQHMSVKKEPPICCFSKDGTKDTLYYDHCWLFEGRAKGFWTPCQHNNWTHLSTAGFRVDKAAPFVHAEYNPLGLACGGGGVTCFADALTTNCPPGGNGDNVGDRDIQVCHDV